MLDDEFDGLETREANDNNTYVFSRIGGHSVVTNRPALLVSASSVTYVRNC